MVDIKQIISIAQQAGQLILSIYHQPAFDVTLKNDFSPLTHADIESHLFICNSLKRLYPDIPIISEESSESYTYDLRKDFNYFFLVDPLDGTKEFIHRNGEFTVNIALIKKNEPVMGVIHAPALQTTYYAQKNKGAFKIKNNEHTQLLAQKSSNNSLRVVISRSHSCQYTNDFLTSLEKQGKQIIKTSSGSALKFGLIAEGHADVYPRFSPTMEWDTAAGHAVIHEIGKQIVLTNNKGFLQYNKENFTNPGFIVQ